MSPFTTLPGFLRRADLVAEYARRSGRDVAAVDFYQVLALYKLAIISEGIYARYLQGKTLGEGFEGMTRPSGALAQRALAIADAADDPTIARHLATLQWRSATTARCTRHAVTETGAPRCACGQNVVVVHVAIDRQRDAPRLQSRSIAPAPGTLLADHDDLPGAGLRGAIDGLDARDAVQVALPLVATALGLGGLPARRVGRDVDADAC